MYIQGLHWQLWKSNVLYLRNITHKLLEFLYLDYHSWTYITTNFNIILVHLIFEMPPRKIQTFSCQQNFWIVPNYGGSSLVTVEK